MRRKMRRTRALYFIVLMCFGIIVGVGVARVEAAQEWTAKIVQTKPLSGTEMDQFVQSLFPRRSIQREKELVYLISASNGSWSKLSISPAVKCQWLSKTYMLGLVCFLDEQNEVIDSVREGVPWERRTPNCLGIAFESDLGLKGRRHVLIQDEAYGFPVSHSIDILDVNLPNPIISFRYKSITAKDSKEIMNFRDFLYDLVSGEPLFSEDVSSMSYNLHNWQQTNIVKEAKLLDIDGDRIPEMVVDDLTAKKKRTYRFKENAFTLSKEEDSKKGIELARDLQSTSPTAPISAHFNGMVVDNRGAPIEGATIELSAEQGYYMSFTGRESKRISVEKNDITDASGSFHISVKCYKATLRISAEGYYPYILHLSKNIGQTFTTTMRLLPQHSLNVVLTRIPEPVQMLICRNPVGRIPITPGGHSIYMRFDHDAGNQPKIVENLEESDLCFTLEKLNMDKLQESRLKFRKTRRDSDGFALNLSISMQNSCGIVAGPNLYDIPPENKESLMSEAPDGEYPSRLDFPVMMVAGDKEMYRQLPSFFFSLNDGQRYGKIWDFSCKIRPSRQNPQEMQGHITFRFAIQARPSNSRSLVTQGSMLTHR